MVAEHEITHVMKQVGFRPYLDFIDRTADMLNMSNDFTRLLLEDTAKRRKINLDDVLMANENEVTEEILKLRVKLYDELNATLYGHIASNKLDGLEKHLRAAFIDWDA